MAVRNHAGIFDVSHMGRVVVGGADATAFIEALVPTSSVTQPAGKSFYTLLLNPAGGIIDDIVIIKRPDDYLVVVNAANKAKDLEHMRSVSRPFAVEIEDITDGSTMIAIQGPEAGLALQPLTPANLSEIKKFTHARSMVGKSDATITRTGYTGEDGFEIILYDSGINDNSLATSVWGDLATRASPCGLGARDSLRIEAGLPLYGLDIDETINPVEAELSWVISKEKTGYVGEEAVTRYRMTPPKRSKEGHNDGRGDSASRVRHNRHLKSTDRRDNQRDVLPASQKGDRDRVHRFTRLAGGHDGPGGHQRLAEPGEDRQATILRRDRLRLEAYQ